MSDKQRQRLWSHLRQAGIMLTALVFLFPFFWMLSTALRLDREVFASPPQLLPATIRWSNFVQAWEYLPFGRFFLNSALVAGSITAIVLAVSSMAGYAFARLRFPGRNVLFGVFLSVLMVPPQLFVIPQYQIMSSLGWLNSLQAIIVPGLFSAFGVFLLRQFFLGLPRELEEAARLDGAGPVRIYWSIMLPLARPGLVALSVLVLLWAWNDLFWPLVVNTDPERMTLSAGLASLQGQYQTDYPVLMAGSLIASLPVIAVFVFLQRQFIQGIAHTGSKG